MPISRRHHADRAVSLGLLLFSWLAIAGPSSSAHSEEARRDTRPAAPNVLLIVTDDQGWGDIQSHGNPVLRTPNLDRLAASGARFDRFFVCPVCAPTRASLLTGRYHPRTGAVWVTRGLETMRSSERTLAELLHEAGYTTGGFGKWHNGAHYPNHPLGQGFDTFLGFCGGHWNTYFDARLERDGRPEPTHGFITDVLTDAALAFIRENRDRPFFCYVPYNVPHAPFQVPDEPFERFRALGLDPTLASVYGMVEHMDANVGRLLATVDDLGLSDRTIILFLTDNGPNTDRFNGGMRGRKGSVHEGGTRVPLFVRWPSRVAPGTTVSRIAAHIDVLPTLLEACSVPVPADLRLDGRSLVPLLTEVESPRWPERELFFHQFRNDRSPLSPTPGAVRTDQFRWVHDGKAPQLFDMRTDPGQERDLAAARPEVAATLSRAYDAWFRDVFAGYSGRPPIPVGFAEVPVVELPAPEAYLQGQLRYAGGAGWANDWITGWTDPAGTIAWELDVHEAGRFDVSLLYGCPVSSVGSRLAVIAGERRIVAEITRPFDPAPAPGPDRVRRTEVDERPWDVLRVGPLELPAGRVRLRVEALEKPGPALIDLKALRLSRAGSPAAESRGGDARP